MNSAELLFAITQYWLIIGGVVAALFLVVGIDRIDEDARGAYVFRPLLIPGILLIWPIVLWRWWSLESGSYDPESRYKPVRAAHKVIALGMFIAVVGITSIGLSVRQQWPADYVPQKLSEPVEASE